MRQTKMSVAKKPALWPNEATLDLAWWCACCSHANQQEMCHEPWAARVTHLWFSFNVFENQNKTNSRVARCGSWWFLHTSWCDQAFLMVNSVSQKHAFLLFLILIVRLGTMDHPQKIQTYTRFARSLSSNKTQKEVGIQYSKKWFRNLSAMDGSVHTQRNHHPSWSSIPWLRGQMEVKNDCNISTNIGW